MRSILKRLIALSLLALVAPFRAGALGLGDIKLNSYLNQPLNARITVLPGHVGSLDQVRVKLAPQAAFEQAGIERLPVLEHIKFKLVNGKDGKPQVKLSSDEPIKEPFLDFILQVTWPNGRISREYTVLLDPPTTTAEHAPPVQPAATASAATQSAPKQTTARPRADTPVSAAAQSAGGVATASPSLDQAKLTKDAYGRTQRDDTLWSIAKTVRPDNSVSVQQVMLALVKKNPKAFYKGNVNTLKAGYVLRLPDKALINQVGQAAAVHEVQRQYRQWQQIKQGSLLADSTNTPADSAAAGHGSAKGAQGKAEAQAGKTGVAPGGKGKTAEEARLTLLPATADKAAAGGAAAASAAKQGQAGQGSGALKKQLDSLQQNQEKQIEALRNQVDELNQQVTSMQRLLSLKDDTLSTLQQKLGTHQGSPAPAQVAPKPKSAQAPAAAAPAKPQVHRSAQPKPQPVAPAPHKAAPPSAQVHGDSGLLADPKVLGMGGVVVLLLSALSWLSVRRRRMNAESIAPEAAVVEDTAGQEAVPEPTDQQADQQYMPTGGDLLEAEINEIDPLAEADVYMAYRRYQQAEDLLRSAIEQEPHRHELQLKLAEVFAAAGNSQAFLAEAQNLHNELAGQNSPVWDKVVEMGREIQPDHPLFTGEADTQAVTAQTNEVTDVAGGDAAPDAVAPQSPMAGDDAGQDVAPVDEPDDLSLDGLAAQGPSGDGGTADLDELPGREPAAEAPEPQPEAKDNSIEFEAGLGQAGSAGDQPEPVAEADSPKGNEIEFDLSAVDESAVDDRPGEPAAGVPETDPLGEDVPQAQDDIPTLDAGDEAAGAGLTLADGGLDTPIDNDTPPLVAPRGETPSVEETGSAPSGDTKQAPGHDLDFDIDFDKVAGRDQDFDNFFEELDSEDAGEGDGETGDEGGQQDVGTKLDLAKAFIEMGDQEGAKEILQEVVNLGNEDQKQEAQGLLQQLQV